MGRCSSTNCCGTLKHLGQRVFSICDAGYSAPEEELTGHALLQKLHEERAREQQAAKQRAVELKAAEERSTREWKIELDELEERRAHLQGEELERDCLSYFAAADLLRQHSDKEDKLDVEQQETSATLVGDTENSSVEVEEAVSKPNIGAFFEAWLGEQQMGASAESWVAALRRGAELAEDEAAGLAGDTSKDEEAEKQAAGLSDKLEMLLAEFAKDAETPQAAEVEESIQLSPSTDDAEARARSAALQKHAEDCREVARRLDPLLPILAEDSATTRLVLALAAMEVGTGLIRAEASFGKDTSLMPAALQALSTADVCSGLCSEKRHIIVDRMLPSIASSGTWTWTTLRRTGFAWWMGGSDTKAREQLETVVTKLAQSSLNKLRTPSRTWDATSDVWGSAPSEEVTVARRLAIDEAVFWSVVLGAGATKLKALLKTGLLKEPDPVDSTGSRSSGGLSALLSHERVEDPTFLRKNAFRLLQLHRFHLAAALFLLGGSLEEAARVLAGHLRDLQLVLVIGRKNRDIIAPLLLDRLDDLPEETGDPWLRFLLAFHAGDLERAAQEAKSSGGMGKGLFDRSLRLSESAEGLSDVAKQLLQK